MRVVVSAIVIGFVLAAALVGAQDVSFSIVAPKQDSRQVYNYVQENQFTNSLDFGAQLVLTSLSIDAQVYVYSQQSSYSLCARFDNQQSTDTCVPVSTQTNTFNFPVAGRAARSVQFTLRGFSQQYGGHAMYIQSVAWLGGPGQVVTRSLASLGGTQPVSLGVVRSFVTQQPGPEGVRITSSDPRAVGWFSQLGLPPGTFSPTTRNQTLGPEDLVLACVNSDLNRDGGGNPSCDYVDEAACAARGRDWFAGHCCGDAPYAQCAFYPDKQSICGQDAQGRFVWASLAVVGVVARLATCPQVDVVSTGAGFLSCGQPTAAVQNIARFQGKTSIAGHEYVCDGNSILECGGTNPYSPNAKRPGDVFNVSGVPNVCAADGKWKASFDGDKASCDAANLGWTGTKCCGEPGDNLSTYEDLQGSGGCFKRQLVRSGSSVANNRDVINHKGTFYICEPDVAQQSSARSLFDNTGVAPTIARSCGDPLQNTLASGSQVHAICSPQGVWTFVALTVPHRSKLVPWQPSGAQVKSGCCPAGRCWDGVECKDRGATMLVKGKGYKCQ